MEQIMEQYFKYIYYRDVIIPIIALSIALLIMLGMLGYELLCRWNDRRRKK